MQYVYLYILPLAIGLHGIFALKFFVDICEGEKYRPIFETLVHGAAPTFPQTTATSADACFDALGATFGGPLNPLADDITPATPPSMCVGSGYAPGAHAGSARTPLREAALEALNASAYQRPAAPLLVSNYTRQLDCILATVPGDTNATGAVCRLADTSFCAFNDGSWGLAQVSSSSQVKSVKSSQVKSGQVRSGQVRSFKSSQVKSSQVKSGQVKSVKSVKSVE